MNEFLAKIRILLFVRPPSWVRGLSPRKIWRMPDDEPAIYLTFDDGPVPGLTPWILQLLEQHGAKASFFCVGENVRRHPELFQSILDAGHSVGNHTNSHVNGYRSTVLSYVRDVYRAHRVIGSRLFRPPYGRIRPLAARILAARFRIVLWDVLSMDYDQGLSPETVLGNVIGNIRNGSVVVFHDNLKARRTLEQVLPKVLDHCSGAGYKFLPLHATLTG